MSATERGGPRVQVAPCGGRRLNATIVMITAITASLNASTRAPSIWTVPDEVALGQAIDLVSPDAQPTLGGCAAPNSDRMLLVRDAPIGEPLGEAAAGLS